MRAAIGWQTRGWQTRGWQTRSLRRDWPTCVALYTMLCWMVLPGLAQTAAPAPSNVQSTVVLSAGWRFHIGDDPAWANPGFDDSSWPTIRLDKPLTEQGIDSYSGYAWYRLHLSPQLLAQAGQPPLNLLLANDASGELAVYLDGKERGHTRGMTASPAAYWTHPFLVEFSPTAPNGGLDVAIRGWVDGDSSSGALSRAYLGSHNAMQDRLDLFNSRIWGSYVLSMSLSGLLYFLVAVLGAVLFLAQGRHSEYLWMALLCVSLVARSVVELCGLQAALPTRMATTLDIWASFLFMAVTLEFILRFTGSKSRLPVRTLQAAALLIPIVPMLHFDVAYYAISLTAQLIFCVLVLAILYRSWRRGLPEAGVMLLPFFVAATGNSINAVLSYAASKGWIPASMATDRIYIGFVGFGLGFFTYQFFLVSLVAVIFYRFIRISEQEQRSSAELEAARSVQAMLIPTELPSTRSFSLDSAYLPINGVGGDFFQALPLKDDSMLIVVGDVSGKGLQAAMNASSLVGALRNELSHDPATVLKHLNQVMLGASLGSGSGGPASFATCLCARIYPSGQMTIANAGHLSPYRDGRELELAPDLPLGIVPNLEYEQATFQLAPGDRLIFLSDGVVEAANAKGELFGFERTQQVSHEPARFIAQTAQKFGQTDDITVVSLYFVPTQAAAPLLQSLQ